MRGECAPCRRAGHLCAAVTVGVWLERNGEELLCLDCANGQPCVVQRCAGQGREESSVRAMRSELGEIVFPGEEERVVHWTPEQLGLARTVPDIPERVTLSLSWGVGAVKSSMSAARVKRDHRQTMRTIVPVAHQVRTPAETPEKDRTMKTDGVECAFEGCKLMAYNGKKYCTTSHGYKNKPAVKHKVDMPKRCAKNAQQPVEIDAGRPGTASSLMNALSKVDAGADQVRVKIEIELTQGEIDTLLDRLSATQRIAFLSNGLRAALLA